MFIGGFIGLILSYAAFSGDEQGRVNILYLLFVFCFIPLASLIISLFSLFNGKGLNLARMWQLAPASLNQQKALYRKLRQAQVDKIWLFMQSQLAGLSYAVASVLIFFIVLLGSDVNFIWRSTLLSADDLINVLSAFSAPWSFWASAQPTVELLQATQDSRLVSSHSSTDSYARWWQFIFAVQLFYSFLPRLVCWLVSRRIVAYKLVKLEQAQLNNQTELNNQAELNNQNKAPKNDVRQTQIADELPSPFTIANWAGVPLNVIKSIKVLHADTNNRMNVGPLASDTEQKLADRWQGNQVLLVKSWEPPLRELADYLEGTRGVIFPLDWEGEQLNPVMKHHLDEWLRFCAQFSHWKIYLPQHLMPQTLNSKEESD